MSNERISTKINKEAFMERIQKINADRETRTVFDCIDRPMRPLVFELARIGMIPKFCCCGYTYDGEEFDEPKTHYDGGAYVHFYVKNDPQVLHNFEQLKATAKKLDWSLNHFQNGIFDLRAGKVVPDNLYKNTDGLEETIHQYEGYALKIHVMAWAIQHNGPTYNNTVEIIDGNSFYEAIDEWMVKAKSKFVILVEDYYSKYGKLRMDKSSPDNIFVPQNNVRMTML
jgi:hypothetical protein